MGSVLPPTSPCRRQPRSFALFGLGACWFPVKNRSGDGKLDFYAFLDNIGLGERRKIAKRAFKVIDANGDGVLVWSGANNQPFTAYLLLLVNSTVYAHPAHLLSLYRRSESSCWASGCTVHTTMMRSSALRFTCLMMIRAGGSR